MSLDGRCQFSGRTWETSTGLILQNTCIMLVSMQRNTEELKDIGTEQIQKVMVIYMDNCTMMQYFEWYLPENGLHWKRLAKQAPALKAAGINMVWLPPAYKGATGKSSVGYDVYDMYDLGEFDQKETVATKYGTKEEYLDAVKALQENGIKVICDVVLNHRMGADGTEEVMVEEELSTDRNQDISGLQQIQAWTKFDFSGRAGKYSNFQWNASHFSGTDWDEAAKRNGIFRFAGKTWNRETDTENGNYDYLMGADLDTDQPEVIKETNDWGKWYQDTVHMDGLRLDAVKHIGFDFYREWMKDMRVYAESPQCGEKDLFIVGEYWSKDLGKLTHYLDVTERNLSLFDVPLHFNFFEAATTDGNFDMRTLYDNTLTAADSGHAVTFVDNHDTQPGQALYSFIPAWFKPHAYALILLRAVGTPCVFYGDYYGIPHDGIEPVGGLPTLLKIRERYAYGEEHLYFDDSSLVGFTREGDAGHADSGIAVLLTDSVGGSKRMCIGTGLAGQRMVDALGKRSEKVVIGEDGWGEFVVDNGAVSVWVTEKAQEYLYTMVE